jgi:signal transduction histidine kinase
MKLQNKTILYYLLASVPLLFVVAIISYFLIARTVSENLTEVQWDKKRKAEALINSFKEPKNVFLSFDSLSNIKIDTAVSGGFKRGYKYSVLVKMDPEDDESIEYRVLKSYYRSQGTNYLITIVDPKLEMEDLIESLSHIFLVTLGFLILTFLILNWILSKTLWKPFYKTINALNGYELKNYSAQHFDRSTTKEFAQLSEALNKMTDKIYSDFVQQKEFTENASHEMQTPLAIIKAKVDLLMQSPNLKEEEMKQLEGIETSVSKLASLNKALLLLAKIENNQFRVTAEVSLAGVTDKVLNNFEDLIQGKGISVTKKVETDLKLKMDPALAEVLITNLVQNSVRHNFENGTIAITITSDQFSITNSGEALSIEPEELFVRFKKNDASKESIGLGLSIVKSIASLYNLKINYAFTDNLHSFTLAPNP